MTTWNTSSEARGEADPGDLTFSLSLYEPPYRTPVRFDSPSSLRGLRLRQGGILVAGLTSSAVDPITLGNELRAVRRMAPGTCLALRLPTWAFPDGADLLRLAGRCHVRGVLVGSSDVVETLRPIVTRPTDLPSEIIEWMTVRGIEIPSHLRPTIRTILRMGPHARELSQVFRALRVGGRTVRSRLRRAGLPSPGKWLRVGTALPAALEIQLEAGSPLLEIAVRHGYSDHSSLSRQFKRLFGLTPGTIRNTLGWEWLVDRWISGYGT